VRMPSSSLLLIALAVLLFFFGSNAHAQSSHDAQRFVASEGGGKEQKTSGTRRNIDTKSDAEWTFATPASKGLSQSSLEVRFAIFFFHLSFV